MLEVVKALALTSVRAIDDDRFYQQARYCKILMMNKLTVRARCGAPSRHRRMKLIRAAIRERRQSYCWRSEPLLIVYCLSKIDEIIRARCRKG